MSNTREIKNRIKSVRDTKKITGAMYLISSTKLRKARHGLDETRPYFDALRKEISRIFRHMPEMQSRFFSDDVGVKKDQKTKAILVISADKGLAGAYNHNVLRLAQEQLDLGDKNILYVVGEYGRQYFKQKGIPVEQSFLYPAQNPTMHRAREITSLLMERFLNEEVDEIILIYTDMKNSMSAEARAERILPLERSKFKAAAGKLDTHTEYEFVPSLSALLEHIVPSYVTGYVYSALVDSFCSEQNARMTAMDAASRNADEMLSTLSLHYNMARQAAITQEITEIAAGARAEKQKSANREVN
jgi:F-type H+-transporting ATPase subunit gamma